MRQYSRIIKACVTGMLLALLASSMDPVLVFAGTIPAGKAVVWNNPSSLFSSETCLSVSSVAFSDTATVIKVLASDPGYNFRLMKNTYLLADDGGKYMIRRCEEYPLGKTMPLKGKPETILTFVFDPVPRRQKSIDMIEDVGTSGLQLIGIHDQRRPLKIKPCSCDGGRELEEMRAGFFKRDSVCIRGRFERVPKDRTGMIHYRDNLTGKGIPAMVSINDDGSFERRIIADQPFIEYLKFGRKSVPFFAMPGGTTDILVHRDGTVDYTDGNGRPLICSNYLRSPLFEMKIYDYESEQKDIKSMTFREYGKKMDSLAEAGVKLVDYLAPRLSFTPLEYVLARESMLLRCTLPLFDFKMEWRLDPKGEETNDPANYAVLRRLPVDDPLAMTELDYYFFQNYYSFLSPIAGKGYVVRDGKGRNIEQSYAEKMRTCLSVDNEIFGRKDPSIMIKVHFLHKLQEEFDCCSDEEWNSDALAAAKEMLASDSAFVSKADMMYRSHLATKDIIRRLPEAEKATMALRKKTDRFKGRYVILDFWATTCGPCRAEIERDEPILESHRDDPDIAFVFITGEDVSPEKAYQEYVSEHLQNGHCFRVPAEEFLMYMELFQFSGIPHYEIMDRHGNIIRDAKRCCFDNDMFNDWFSSFKSKLEQ